MNLGLAQLPQPASSLSLRERATRAMWGKAMHHVENKIDRVGTIGTPNQVDAGAAGRDVILVPGYGNLPASMGAIGRSLQRDGFRVHYLEIDERGMADAATAVGLLHGLVEQVRVDHPGAALDIVAHSRGGVVARMYAKEAVAAGRPIDRVVTITSANQGTSSLGPFKPLLPNAMREIVAGSRLIDALKSGVPTPGPTRFTALSSDKSDLVLFPSSAGRLDAADNVDNVVVDAGRGRVTHYGVLTDHAAYDAIRGALAATPDASNQ